MYADFATALSVLKTASDLTTLVLKAKVDSAVTQKAIDLQSAIISLQSAIMGIQTQNQELLTENNRLKQEMIAIKNWEAEAEKYTLKEIAPGVFVYAINHDQLGNQPSHWLWTQCYENKHKAILQRKEKGFSGTSYFCPNCKVVITDYTDYLPARQSWA